jgi:hypothetical protein
LYLGQEKQEQKIIKITASNVSLQADLDALQLDLATAVSANITQSAEAQATANELNAKIKELQEKLKRNGQLSAAELNKAKQEIAELKAQIAQYAAEIVVLKQENTTLANNNATLSSEVTQTKQANATLTQENNVLENKVKIAQVLKAGSINVTIDKRKKNGTFVKTDRNKAVDRITIDFSIVENELAPEGKCAVYMQVIDPSGKIMPQVSSIDEIGQLIIGGTKAQYSTGANIMYSKKNPTYSISWLNSNNWVPGQYTIKLFTDNGPLGTTIFALRK